MRVIKNSKIGKALLASAVMVTLFALPEAGYGFDAMKKNTAALQARTIDGVLEPQKYLEAINNPRLALDQPAAPGNLTAVFEAAISVPHSAAETVRARYPVPAGGGAVAAYIKALVLQAISVAAPGTDDDAKRNLKIALGLDPNPANAAAVDHFVTIFVEDAVEETYTKGLIRSHLNGIGNNNDTTIQKLETIRDKLRAGTKNAKTGNNAGAAARNSKISDELTRLGL